MKERGLVDDLDVEKRVILKLLLKKQGGSFCVNRVYISQDKY
jgi:hypothetical protein